MLSIEQRIWQQVTLHPDKLAVKSGKDTATYSELVSRIIAAKVFFFSHFLIIRQGIQSYLQQVNK